MEATREGQGTVGAGKDTGEADASGEGGNVPAVTSVLQRTGWTDLPGSCYVAQADTKLKGSLRPYPPHAGCQAGATNQASIISRSQFCHSCTSRACLPSLTPRQTGKEAWHSPQSSLSLAGPILLKGSTPTPQGSLWACGALLASICSTTGPHPQ